MTPLLYSELVPFYHLLDPLDDHAEEGEELGGVLRGAMPSARSLLELGSGAGHGAHFIKRRFQSATLCDMSEAMLARSRRLNPDCEHVAGDMRCLRLDRAFDCVLIHDAIAYMTAPEDLLATFRTAYDHLVAGGAALFVPDCTKESFVEGHEVHAGADEQRSLRCLSWHYDPDPSDHTHLTDFAFLLGEGGEVRAVHDRHTFGLFSIGQWTALCEQAGFSVDVIKRPLPPEYDGSAYCQEMFLCRREAGGAGL